MYGNVSNLEEIEVQKRVFTLICNTYSSDRKVDVSIHTLIVNTIVIQFVIQIILLMKQYILENGI